MKKWLLNLTGILTISSSALPLTGCTFNFYVNKVKNKLGQTLATQTSNVIKSLVVSKTLNSDTQSTINDILNSDSQTIIKNNSSNQNFNNFGDFIKSWGYQEKLSYQGFDQDKFIVANGHGSLTSKIKNLDGIDNILKNLDYINNFSAINNQTLYGLTINENALARPVIINFFKSLQKADPKDPTTPQYLLIIKNLINNYESDFLNPLKDFLTFLSQGWTQTPTIKEVPNFFKNWKDENNQPYSQWVTQNEKKEDEWTMNEDYYQEWSKNDINLYYGGVMINYLFYKMGKENNFEKPEYLGDIISDGLNAKNPADAILNTIKKYSNLIINPNYLLLIMKAILPLIKEKILNMPDISQGIKYLTLGNKYPTKKENNSFNIKDIFIKLKQILNNKENVRLLIDQILTSSFLSDIKVNYDDFTAPISELLKLPLPEVRTIKNQLIDTLVNFLVNPNTKDIFDNIFDIVSKLNDQYYSSDGINLDLKSLETILVGQNGLLTLLNQVAKTLSEIIKPTHDIDQNETQDLENFYTSLGGQIPKSEKELPSINFKENSFLWLLKNSITDSSSSLNIFIKIITRKDNYQGISNILVNQNESWIKKNYTNYLNFHNATTKITNINLTRKEEKNQIIYNISYQFFYQLKEVNYHFSIKGIIVDDKNDYIGIHNFKFQNIYALNY